MRFRLVVFFLTSSWLLFLWFITKGYTVNRSQTLCSSWRTMIKIQIMNAFVKTAGTRESSFQFPVSSFRPRKRYVSVHHIDPGAVVS